ncbi:YhjD/YihY/BrkB family envelope integrity protein [Cellulomonas sp. URHB0016]
MTTPPDTAEPVEPTRPRPEDAEPTRARRLAAELAGRLRGTAAWRLGTTFLAGFVRIEPFDRAMTLAAQAFTSIVPVLIVTAAFGPSHRGPGVALADAIGLPQSTRDELATSVPPDAAVASSIGLLGVLVALITATAYSRALERMYAKIWDVGRPGLRTAWRWLATVGAVVVAVAVLRITRQVTAGATWSQLAQLAVEVVVWSAVWTFVPWVLLQHRVPARTLVGGGLVSAIALAVLDAVGNVYLPLALEAGARQYGVLGLTFAYIGWLFALSFAIVVAAVAGRACAVDDGRLGRLFRGEPLSDWHDATD